MGTIAYENPFNLSNSYGSLGFDNRHQAAADLLWMQPFKASNKVLNAIDQRLDSWDEGVHLQRRSLQRDRQQDRDRRQRYREYSPRWRI